RCDPALPAAASEGGGEDQGMERCLTEICLAASQALSDSRFGRVPSGAPRDGRRQPRPEKPSSPRARCRFTDPQTGRTKWTRKPLQATIVTPKQALTIGGGTLRS